MIRWEMMIILDVLNELHTAEQAFVGRRPRLIHYPLLS